LLTARIVAFLDDIADGKDLQKYRHPMSPIKHNPTFSLSPSKPGINESQSPPEKK
jgi:hypothetical protein